MSLAGFSNWLILRKTTTVHRKVVEANQFPLTGKTRGAKAFRWSFSLWRQFLKLGKEKNKQNRIFITNTSTATPEPDQTSRDSHPGIYIRLLIKSHFLTFSYTASHLPLEFTVGVLPPLFLWTQRAVISVRHHGTLGKKWENLNGRRKLTAASTLAGESLLGSASMEITLIMIVSTVWMGSQRSSGFS